MKHLVVIDPAMQRAEFECFNEISKRMPIPTTYHLPGLYGAECLSTENLDSVAGVIILGSATSVLSQLSWQKNLKNWLETLFTTDIPTLGICYGHQLIASMFGASLGFVSPTEEKLKGLRKVAFQPGTHPWHANLSHQSGEVVVSHREEVKNCPNNFYVLATSSKIAIEGLAHVSKPIYSFQFHPEATPSFLHHHDIALTGGPHPPVYGWQIMEAFIKQLRI